MPVQDYLPERDIEWDEAGHERLAFFMLLRDRGMIDQDTFAYEMDQIFPAMPTEEVVYGPRPSLRELAEEAESAGVSVQEVISWYGLTPEEYGLAPAILDITVPPPSQAEMAEEAKARGLSVEQVESEYELRGELYESMMKKERGYLANAFYEVLKSLWQWTLKQLKALIDLVVGTLKPVLEKAWEFARSKLEDTGRVIYDGVAKLFEGHSPITPEDAPAMALKLYLFAMGMGMAAHGTATVTELLHPLKRVGLHQTAAAIGDFASFGRIAGATIGPLMTRVLGQSMTYAVQKKYQPLIPDEKLLQIMAVKPDITMDEFRNAIRYHGYSEEWIDAIQRTMFREPRYFELKMMAEDEAATKDWLFLKSRRGGYTEDDSKIYVSSFIKAATRAQRVDYYRQAFYQYKEGYITEARFDEMLAELELRPEAHHFAKLAADLAYLTDTTRDMIRHYTDSYLKDVIDDDELLVSLVGLGVVPKRAWLMTAQAKIRKQPKPTRKVAAPVKKALSDIQKKYITLYATQYRKELITQERYLESLLAIGLEPDLAEVTVAIEAAKKGILTVG